MRITNDQIGRCGVRVGAGFCPCEDYRRDPGSQDRQGEARKDDFCICGHHRVMHATRA